jgi:HTH-type transcriptional regulator, quorum sensing regulator NprR
MGGVGQRIKELRKASQMTQQELAEGVVTRSYISQIEKGLIQPSYDTLEKLSKKLDCSVEDFFKEPENTALRIAEWKKYIRFAEGQIESGQYDQARRNLEKCNFDPEAEAELNDHDLGILNWVKGKLFENDHEYEQAIPCYEQSLEHFANILYVKERVRSLSSLGYVNLRLDRNQSAMKILNNAYELLLQNQIGGLIRISVLINYGVAHSKLQEHHSAIRLLNEAMEINRAMDTHYKAGHIFMMLGVSYMEIEEWSDAERLYQRAINLYSVAGDELNQAGSYTNLGELYRKYGRYAESIEALRTGIALYRQLGAWDDLERNAELELARSFVLNGEISEAEVLCQKIMSSTSDFLQQATALKILGVIEGQQGRPARALEYLTESHRLFERYGTQAAAQVVLEKIADTQLELGNFEQAARCYQQLNRAKKEYALV